MTTPSHAQTFLLLGLGGPVETFLLLGLGGPVLPDDPAPTKPCVILTCGLVAPGSAVNFSGCGGISGGVPYQVPPPQTRGCTHPAALNYNPLAAQDDGSCIFGTTAPPMYPGTGIGTSLL